MSSVGSLTTPLRPSRRFIIHPHESENQGQHSGPPLGPLCRNLFLGCRGGNRFVTNGEFYVTNEQSLGSRKEHGPGQQQQVRGVDFVALRGFTGISRERSRTARGSSG